ncbi:hypothetical protein, partial [Nocardiopsis protaetiae]
MSDNVERDPGPGRREAARPLALTPDWGTVHTRLDVLLVVHSLTCATRIADVLPAFDDPRVQLHCARTTGGVFAAGVDEHLRANGLEPLPWETAREMEFDLVVAASLGDDLHEIHSKILRLPHGNGYNKHWNSTGSREPGAGSREPGAGSREPGAGSREVFGLSDGTLKHQGRLVPGAIALSHHEQLDRLREGCPDALPLAFLAGDPCHDRLLASLPRILHYRRALLPHPERTLITINSTWKHESLFGIDPSYIPEIIAELPHDEFQVALILHPNVWAAHGRRQIESWLAEALRSGLLLIPPDEGWRAAVVAADHVISDHGSVGVYAAALGRPVLLAPEGRAAVDPRSGLGRLYTTALPLDRHAPLRPQLAKAAELRERTRAVAETWVSSAPGASLDLIRARAYRMMGAAPPPGRPPRLAVPVPEIRRGGPGSLWTAVEPAPGEPGVLRVRRTPAAVLPQGPGDAALVCSDDEPDHRLAAAADVFTAARDTLPAAAGRWS